MLKIAKLFLTITFFTLIFFLSGSPTLAAKPRVWNTNSTTTAKTTATRPSFSVRFRSDRRALNVNFYNVSLSESISYELTYQGNDLDQGVVGTVRPNEGASAFRLLLFGTCSKNVCTYHRNIKNTQLKITAKLLDGRTLIKKYQIKV